MSAAKKLLVVFGATGNQGGSVIRSILADPNAASQFAIRAITRDPSKPSSQALASKGCEVVSANLDDKASITAALKDAYAVFAVTNYWEKLDAALEIKQGSTVADVCKELGVQHLIWSSLMSITKLSNGQLTNVHHFDAKAEVETYIRSLGIPATFFMPGFFMSNMPTTIVKVAPSNAYVLPLPIPTSTPLPLLDTERDTGKFIKGILLHRDRVLGKQIYGATAYWTLDEIMRTFEAVKPVDGKGAKAVQITGDEYKKSLADKGMPGFVQQELLENFLLNDIVGYFGRATLDESHSIVDEPLSTFKEHLERSTVIADLK